MVFLDDKRLNADVEAIVFGYGIEHRSLPSGKGEGGMGFCVKNNAVITHSIHFFAKTNNNYARQNGTDKSSFIISGWNCTGRKSIW